MSDEAEHEAWIEWQQLQHEAERQEMIDALDHYRALFDPTPLTEEVLRASGYSEGCDNQWVHVESVGLTKSSNTDDGWYPDYHPDGCIKTVGDLRRLLSALHIDCEVKA